MRRVVAIRTVSAMTTTLTTGQTAPTIDPATVARLSRGFHDTFRNLVAADDVFSSDVFCDLNMPVWRFQLLGPEAWIAQLRTLAQGDGQITVKVMRTVPTVSGFVTEHEESQDVAGQALSARRLWLCEVRDGRIAEVVGYCSGEWDEELRSRHAVEAPMIRP